MFSKAYGNFINFRISALVVFCGLSAQRTAESRQVMVLFSERRPLSLRSEVFLRSPVPWSCQIDRVRGTRIGHTSRGRAGSRSPRYLANKRGTTSHCSLSVPKILTLLPTWSKARWSPRNTTPKAVGLGVRMLLPHYHEADADRAGEGNSQLGHVPWRSVGSVPLSRATERPAPPLRLSSISGSHQGARAL
jgi:hypothetical protein